MNPAMRRQRYAHLDALRAVAALAVMVEHLFGDLLRQAPAATGPMSTLARSAVENLSLGRFGVVLFFLISGFVVPFSIRGERPLRHFAISRLFRLYPAFWLALAVLAAMAWLSGGMPRAVAVLANLTMAPPLFGQPWLSPIHWTLFVELLFYGLVALLFAAGALRQVGILLALSLALIAATVLPVQLRMHGIASLPIQYLGLHLSFLILGLLLRLWLVEGRRGAWLAALVLVLAQLAGVSSVAQFSLTRGDNFVMEGLRPVLAAYLLALVVFLAALRLERPHSHLLARIGLTSYSMYLFHGMVNALVYRVLPLTGEFGDLAVMLACTGLTLALSWLVYRVVERPMIALGRRIASRSTSLAVAAAPEHRAGDRLVAAVLGTAIAAVTLSWFALLGYVGWSIAEAL
ncbi:MAG: acyltransferase [Bosea sp.]|uniref:acyltransferase family protein n=1 Tax=Bosea sp. (in: a-proteobacteria) TaxID=1871050 RepID=UPI00239C6342|nr:acyltransferase [Bosea sp. (in: a-proteobacteria)]MCP4739535.1 acyltransferase [Bosea sp. (in: a-proteobacteria)]